MYTGVYVYGGSDLSELSSRLDLNQPRHHLRAHGIARRPQPVWVEHAGTEPTEAAGVDLREESLEEVTVVPP